MLIFDATPLIYLAKADRLGELAQLGQEKVIPETVYREVVEKGREEGKPDAEEIYEAVKEGDFQVKSFDEELEVEAKNLSKADMEVIKLAERENVTAVMDEEHGRNIAEAKGVQTRGTAYLVLKMQKKKIITQRETEQTIDDMIDKGWYCSTDLYKEIMNKIDGIAGS